MRVLLVALAVFFSFSLQARAQDCTSPDGYVGVILYNPTFDTFQGCTLRGWMGFHHADASPPPAFAFNFTDQSGVSQGSTINSDIVLVSGVGASVPITITGQGNPEFRSCSDATCTTEINTWTNVSFNVSDGEYLQLRLTSSELSMQTHQAFLQDGTNLEIWSVQTQLVDDCAAPSPTPGAICPDGTIFAGMSPDGNVKMYATRCDEGQSWDGSSCTGSRVSLSWNNGNNSDYVTTGATSTVSGETNTSTLDGLDSDSATAGVQAHQAAQRCADLSANGHTDWYLPASQELDVLYLNNAVIGNFDNSGSSYWSSSENNDNNARGQRFSDGFQLFNFKLSTRFLRCVRR